MSIIREFLDRVILLFYKFTGVGVGMQPAGVAKGGGNSSWRKDKQVNGDDNDGDCHQG